MCAVCTSPLASGLVTEAVATCPEDRASGWWSKVDLMDDAGVFNSWPHQLNCSAVDAADGALATHAKPGDVPMYRPGAPCRLHEGGAIPDPVVCYDGPSFSQHRRAPAHLALCPPHLPSFPLLLAHHLHHHKLVTLENRKLTSVAAVISTRSYTLPLAFIPKHLMVVCVGKQSRVALDHVNMDQEQARHCNGSPPMRSQLLTLVSTSREQKRFTC